MPACLPSHRFLLSRWRRNPTIDHHLCKSAAPHLLGQDDIRGLSLTTIFTVFCFEQLLHCASTSAATVAQAFSANPQKWKPWQLNAAMKVWKQDCRKDSS